jgi:NADPH:quinone reductase-like Zn-dependent oxidoreductase
MNHRRVVVTHHGGPEALRVLEEEFPAPRANEVRVKVLAAGVALPDLMMREGIHPETPRLPLTPGWDLVGVVDRPGDRVSGIEPGRIVAALLQLGLLAGLEIRGTCSSGSAAVESALGGVPIDDRDVDFVAEIRRLTDERAHEILGKGGITGKIVLECEHSLSALLDAPESPTRCPA